MRVAVVLGLGSSTHHLQPFERTSAARWQPGLPARASDADAILVLGGDGTVHRHLTQLVTLQLPVLVVPCGSGNDFARALDLRRIRDSVVAWQEFCSGGLNVRAIDLGVIMPLEPSELQPSLAASGPRASESHRRRYYFCCIGGVGLDVEVARRANRLPRWVRRLGGYGLSLLPELSGFKPLSAT